MTGRLEGRQISGSICLPVGLVLLVLAGACGTPVGTAPGTAATPVGDPARAIARQGDFVATLDLVPWAELSPTPPPAGALRNFGYRVEVDGPAEVHVDIEVHILRERGIAWSAATIDHATFRRDPGQDLTTPLGRLTGPIVLADGAQPGDEVALRAIIRLPDSWFTSPPGLWLRLAAEPEGGLTGAAASPTLTLGPDEELPTRAWTAIAPTVQRASPAATRPPGVVRPPEAARLATTAPTSAPATMPAQPSPTPWPQRTAALGADEAVRIAAALLPPPLVARAEVGVEPGADEVWRITFDGLRARADELGWPDAISSPEAIRPTLMIATVVVEVDATTDRPPRAEAFADPAGPPEQPQPRAREALPDGKAIVYLPPSSRVRAHLPDPSGFLYIRPLGDEELRAWGFTVVRERGEFERAATGQGAARVLWLHRDALSLVEPAWLRARYEEGIAVGLLDGPMSELGRALGLSWDDSDWLQPGPWGPLFAIAYTYHCAVPSVRGNAGGGQSSERLSLSWVVGVTMTYLPDPCA
jgi:hypothetical protein